QRPATVEVLLRFIRAALQQAHESALGVSIGHVRVQRNGSGEVSLSPFQIAFGLPVCGAIKPGVGKARVELDGLAVIGQRAVEIAFYLPRRAAITEGFVAVAD